MLITFFRPVWHGLCAAFTAEACPERAERVEGTQRTQREDWGEPGFVFDYAVAGGGKSGLGPAADGNEGGVNDWGPPVAGSK